MIKEKTINNANIKLNHPVLYLFFENTCKSHNILKNIMSFYEEKIQQPDAVAYLNILPEHFDEDNKIFINNLHEVQNKFLKNVYSKPTNRRIYFVINMNDKIKIDITNIINLVTDYFKNMNNICIIDFFAIVDEQDFENINIAENFLILQNLSKQKLCNMVYVLSNFNSNMTIGDFEEIYKALPLCSIIKDSSYSNNTGLNLYNEHEFLENSKYKNPEGYFYTFGTKKIEKPNDLIKAIVIREILIYNLNFKREIKNDKNIFGYLNSFFYEDIESFFAQFFTKINNNIFSLAINTNKQNQMFDEKGQIIKEIFGQNKENENFLDIYYSLNFEKFANEILQNEQKTAINFLEQTIQKLFFNIDMGFYEAVDVLIYLKNKILHEIENDLAKKLEENERFIKVWINQQYVGNNKKSITMFGAIYEFPFILAKEYLNIFNQNKKYKISINILKELKSLTNKYLDDIDSIKNKIDESVLYLQNYISSNINTKSLIIKENLQTYYSSKTQKYILDNYKDCFEKVYNKFYVDGEKNTDLIFENCNLYANTILDSKDFNENVYSEIYNRISENHDNGFNSKDKIAEMIFNEIVNNKIYFSKLMFTEKLYENTCLITGDISLIDNFKNFNANLEIFYDKTDKSLNIIYFMGAFSTFQMFYGKRYLI